VQSAEKEAILSESATPATPVTVTPVTQSVTAAPGTDLSKPPIARLLHQCRRAFALAFVLTLLINILSITPILYMINTFDRVISTRSGITLISLTSLVIGLYIFWSSLEWIRSRLMVRLSLRIDWDLAAEVFDASFRRYVGRKNVNVHQLLGDLLTLRQFLTGQPVFSIMDAPFAVVFIIIGAMFHPYLAVFVIVAAVLMLITSYATQKISGPILKASNDANAEATRIAANSLRSAETTLALGMMGAVRNRWYAHHRKFLEMQVNASEASGLTGGFSGFLTKALPSLQMGLGAWLAIEGLITGGMVIAATMLISKAVSPIQSLITNWKEIVSARQSYDRLNLLLAEDVKLKTQMELPAPVGKLDVVGASAIPPGFNKAVVSDINFSVKPGEAVAIVGPSAAGKTSLTRMLVGVWVPSSGSVRLDGVELSEWNHDEVGPNIGYVPQEIEFFEGTVAENIARLGEVNPDKVIQAAKLIGIHEIILALPKGYDTMLGETGFQLSGGQRQRVAIARAFYGMPKYLVLDEPNANLDEVGESILAQAVDTLKKAGSSVIITTHRPRLIGVVDKLLVLRNGRQVGFGPAQEMLNAVRNLQVVAGQAGPKPATAGTPAASAASAATVAPAAPASTAASKGEAQA
jgi:ATP-binding cassette subfamily C exporter for protease/lipase